MKDRAWSLVERQEPGKLDKGCQPDGGIARKSPLERWDGYERVETMDTTFSVDRQEDCEETEKNAKALPCSSPVRINGVSNPATPSYMRGSASASGLPPRPESLKLCASDPTPSPAKTFSRSPSSGDMEIDEETPYETPS
ncbi:hypothetical protein VNO77_46811 [Canavalia gladiata]|uniref:Uncharacterized protein n=1 Tax=Canavalia gladiata TaxID=3824 RepID=A0AAN9JHJ3_CANGL